MLQIFLYSAKPINFHRNVIINNVTIFVFITHTETEGEIEIERYFQLDTAHFDGVKTQNVL